MVNRVLVHSLRTHFGCSKQWDNYFHILQHSYNKATHSSTRFSPFEVCLGFQPASPVKLPLTLAPQGTLHQQKEQISAQWFLQQISLRHTAVTTTLKEAQDQAKQHHDKQRKFLTFQPGDKVWLHLDKKIFKGKHHKILPIRYGPYSILDKIGENAYRLDLPPQLGVHNVINVNHVKLFEPPYCRNESSLLIQSTTFQTSNSPLPKTLSWTMRPIVQGNKYTLLISWMVKDKPQLAQSGSQLKSCT